MSQFYSVIIILSYLGLVKSVGIHLQAVFTENYPVFFSCPCWWSDPIMTHMYHICIIYVSYMYHIWPICIIMWMACKWKERRGKGKRIAATWLWGLASLPNCYIRQVNPSQASLRMGSAHEEEEGTIWCTCSKWPISYRCQEIVGWNGENKHLFKLYLLWWGELGSMKDPALW